MGVFPNPIRISKRVNRAYDFLENGRELYKIARYSEDGMNSEGQIIYILAKSKEDAFSIAISHFQIRSEEIRSFQETIKNIEKIAASNVLIER